MKKLLIVSALVLGLSAFAQPPGKEPSAETDRTQIRREAQEKILVKPEKGDQIEGRRFTYSGVLVQAVKADNPAQLINPAAGDKYGDPENNVVREPKTERVIGLKLFALRF